MPLYFAYGSNMDRAAMAARCPASRPLGLARLARHRPVIMREGYLSVAGDPRRTVPGLLWDLALADVPALDRYEEVGAGLYAKRHLPVATGAGARRALVYVGANAGPGSPRSGYLKAVIEAGREAGLPAPYLAELAALGACPASPRLGGRPGPVPAVRPTRATPLDRARVPGGAGWSWTP